MPLERVVIVVVAGMAAALVVAVTDAFVLRVKPDVESLREV
jgi:hypothetical protein